MHATPARDGPRAPTHATGPMTPMMEQYWRAKKEQPEALLFFRMGDFYELFHEDARVAARELGIALTSRSKGEDAIAMAGVPVRAVEAYLIRLVRKGFKVAICEQMEDPRHAKGIVDRAIVRVVTAGTLTEDDALDARVPNHLASFHEAGAVAGIAWIDVSTGRCQAIEIATGRVGDELARIAPAEVLCASGLFERDPALAAEIRDGLGARISERDGWCFGSDAAHRTLLRRFGTATLEGFGIGDGSPIVPAAGALLDYVEETQKSACAHVLRIELVARDSHLVLDRATRSCLEIFETQRDGRREGTLLAVLDATVTPMGGRLLREWLAAPLRSVDAIRLRQGAVAELVEQPFLREDLRDLLGRILDVERLVSRVSTGRAHGRDLAALRSSIAAVAPLRARLAEAACERLSDLRDGLDTLDDVHERIERTLVDDPPLGLREGGLIRAAFSTTLDELRAVAGDGKSAMARFQAREIERTGISTLRVGFHSVFGYYVEVPRGQAGGVPADYVRRQTVKNSERYITPELKEFEDKVLHSEERARDLEYDLFLELRESIGREIPRILATARAIAEIDALASLAQRAAEHRYVAPVVDDGDEVRIVDGRHPVVERNPRAEAFVPNDSLLDRDRRLLTVLTGPNMAGKSTWIRQTALIVLMAQVGSFVPAAEARIGVADRIFTRIGSADDIGRNASTFMVEMVEIANILNNATERSLIVLDEVGRGTSTFDGLALAWAIVEHIHDRVRARTLFATHYHQLTDLADRLRGVCNRSVAVREWNEEIVFLHKIVEGGTDRSYGIHVARLAGVPRELIERARAILSDIEADAAGLAPRIASSMPSARGAAPGPVQLALFDAGPSAVEKRLAELDPDRMTPIEALLALRELKQRLEDGRG